MEEDKLLQLQEQVAKALLTLRDNIADICTDLSDEDIRELVAHYRTEAQPTDTHNFPMPIYQEIAEMLEGELGIKIAFRRAEEYMGRTGETFYCVACQGTCKGHE